MHCFSCVLQNNLYHLIHLHIQFHTVCRRHIIRHLEYKYQAGAPCHRNRTLMGLLERVKSVSSKCSSSAQCSTDRLVQYNRELRADAGNVKTDSVRPGVGLIVMDGAGYRFSGSTGSSHNNHLPCTPVQAAPRIGHLNAVGSEQFVQRCRSGCRHRHSRCRSFRRCGCSRL